MKSAPIFAVALLWLPAIPGAFAQPATRPAATQPATTLPARPQAHIQPAVAGRITDRARRQAQRQSASALPDGGTYKLDQLIRFTVIDGRLCSELLAGHALNAPARRIRIEGSDAVWMLNTFSNGIAAHHTLIRYDFDVPDDQFWMVSYTFQERTNTASVFAQAGEASDVSRVYYSQQPGGVALNLAGWDDNNRVRQRLSASSADLFQLRNQHPEAVRKYLLPALRKLTQQAMLRPGPADVYRAFPSIPADREVTRRLHALLPRLNAQSPDTRQGASAELMSLGRAGALAALRTDPDLLLPEQAARLGELVMAHSRMTPGDPLRAAADVQFLIDCLEDEDRAVRLSAAAALERRLARKLDFDPDAPAPRREAFTDQFRARLAGEPSNDQRPPIAAPDPAGVPRLRG